MRYWSALGGKAEMKGRRSTTGGRTEQGAMAFKQLHKRRRR